MSKLVTTRVETRGEAGRVLRVAQIAHVLDGRGLGDELARGVAEHGLFVVQVEGHSLSLRHSGESRNP